MEFYTKAFFVVLAAFVGYGLLLVLQPFAGALAWAIFLAFILYPVHVWLTRKLKGRAGWSAGILTGVTPFALLTPLAFLGVVFANQARALIAFVQEKDVHFDATLLAQTRDLPGHRADRANTRNEELSVSGADLQQWLTNATQTVLKNVAAISGGVALSALGSVDRLFPHAVPAVLHVPRRAAACSCGSSG